jgi:hypothetical protein
MNNKILIACALVLVAVAAVVLYVFDPSEYVLMPKCPFKMLTGLDCPGCGFQRAMHALLHGHVAEAIRFNVFLVVAVPYLLALLVANFLCTEHHKTKLLAILESRTAIWTYVVLYVAWMVIRNV